MKVTIKMVLPDFGDGHLCDDASFLSWRMNVA